MSSGTLKYDRAKDPDFDPAYSRAKSGGYHWAGAWIDPSVPMSGPKEHPTMSVEESNKRYAAARSSLMGYALKKRRLYEKEGSAF